MRPFKTLTKTLTAAVVGLVCSATPAQAAEGDLDPSFGGNGRVRGEVGIESWPGAMAVQPNGRIVTVGSTNRDVSSLPTAFVMRYLPDGSVDSGFGHNGVVRTRFGRSADWTASASGVAIDEHRRIVVVGALEYNYSAGDRAARWAIERYEANGELDRSFGGDGRITIGFARPILGPDSCCLRAYRPRVEVQPDGRVLLGGTMLDTDRVTELWTFYSALVRLNADGSLDRSFSRNGRTLRRLTDPSYAVGFQAGMDLAPNGSVVVGEYRQDGLSFTLARYRADGSFAGVFGDVTKDIGPDGDSGELVVADDGSIVAVGRASSSSGDRWAIARYLQDGSLDSSFARDGTTTLTFDTPSYHSSPQGVVVQEDDRIVVTGRATIGRHNWFTTARFKANGQLDPSFGGDGKIFTGWVKDRRERGWGFDVALQPDDKIVAFGLATFYTLGLVRYAA